MDRSYKVEDFRTPSSQEVERGIMKPSGSEPYQFEPLAQGADSAMPEAITGACSTYFFKGKEYWRVPGSDMEAEKGYPRLIAKDWLLCTEMQSDSPDTDAKSKNTRVNVHRHPDHAENGYEVCSCTSDTASPLGVWPTMSTLWLLPPMWTVLLSFCSEQL
ncbi:hypothetical protein CRENBAI_017814 [Crenichthys baileyi]|uniref:Uncharacterized protein n=1 Tax=Crenichthys baileyi TaxID=28760 RepID=A0AAV9SHK3_9TELE